MLYAVKSEMVGLMAANAPSGLAWGLYIEATSTLAMLSILVCLRICQMRAVAIKATLVNDESRGKYCNRPQSTSVY